ncbi:Crp/Fnr family transcriptional regulator [Actinokineospora pegani]|uniref:Crp/Fnr family transcriptional regulator n=1 Tax=Actinokineospora pegani TaxID=2654637 RepID=UPI0012EA2ABB|nr:Crp/Fnr family transcriptional regulator [Actinokineospora pegani]
MGSPSAGRARLRAEGRPWRFAPGDRLLSTGDPSDEVMLIETGLTKVVLLTPDSGPTVAGLVGPGELIGEAGVIHGAPRSATIEALTVVHVVRVAASVFLRLRATVPDIGELVDETWREQRGRADLHRVNAARDVHTRVRETLRHWALSFGDRTSEGLLLRGPSQHDLALAVGASHERVESALSGLRDEGVLKTSRRRFLFLGEIHRSP